MSDPATGWPEAARLGEAARGRTAPNPNVGCVIVKDGEIVGRGATAPGGRPHAEAVALKQAGKKAQGRDALHHAGALRPCQRARADLRRADPRSRESPGSSSPSRIPTRAPSGEGIKLLRKAGIEVKAGVGEARRRAHSMSGYLSRIERGRPRITLKLALSIDGKIALPSGESKWITGEDARAHVHLERAHSDMILVGRGTYHADQPKLDVRLPGLEQWSPRRALLTSGEAVEGWEILHSPQDVYRLHDVNDLLVEGGSATATAFLAADLVDRILIYRAPILVGEGKSSVGYIGLDAIADAHGRWQAGDGARLGIDRLEVYERVRD